MKPKLIVFLFMIFICNNALGEWLMIADNDRFETYIDFSTKRINSNTVSIWTLTNYNKLNKNHNYDYLSSMEKIVYDCIAETETITALVLYRDNMGKGGAVRSSSLKEYEYNIRLVTPNSIGEEKWKLACGKEQ